MTFSVILPVYNRAASIAATLENVLCQLRPEDEVIVVDDGSTDALVDVLRPYEERIIFIRQQNGGPAKARNTGAWAATGDWLLFQDSDDLWTPDRISALLRDLRQVPGDVVCHLGDVLYRGQTYEQSLFSIKAVTFPSDRSVIVDDALPLVISGMSLIGSAVRREVYLNLGGLDEEMRYLEDTDFFSRLALEGRFLVTGACLAIAQRLEGDEASVTRSAERDPSYAPRMMLQMVGKLRPRPLSSSRELLVATRLSAAEFMLASTLMERDPAAARGLLIRAARHHPSVLKGWTKSLLVLVFGRRLFEFLVRRRAGLDRG